MIGCENKLMLAGVAGAAVAMSGYDTAIKTRFTPPFVHHFLGGVAVDYYCRGMAMDMETVSAGAVAVTGAMALALFR